MDIKEIFIPLCEQEDYHGEHRPASKDGGAPLWDLTQNGIYPDDVYTHPYYYAAEMTGTGIFLSYHNRPNKPIKIYRAVPHEETPAEGINRLEKQLAQYMRRRIVPAPYAGSSGFEKETEWYEMASNELERLKQLPVVKAKRFPITPGDWVTLSSAYANEHGRAHLGGKPFKIVTKTVYARDLYTDGNSLDEWGYDPTPRIRMK